jgi:hypothetical protein
MRTKYHVCINYLFSLANTQLLGRKDCYEFGYELSASVRNTPLTPAHPG